MRYRRFGRSDLEVSEVGFGMWTFGVTDGYEMPLKSSAGG